MDGETVDDWFKAIGELTMNEFDILHGLDASTYEFEIPDWMPGVRTRDGLKHLPRTMSPPESKFATYCKTVLSPLYKYLEEAVVVYKENKTVICHGGLIWEDIRDDLKDIKYAPNEESTFVAHRHEPGFLTRLNGHDLNSVLAADRLCEITGHIEPCTFDNDIHEGHYGDEGVALVIVGHTPTRLGVPVINKRESKWLIALDTQYSTRNEHNSCTAFNMDGSFTTYYTFRSDTDRGEIVTAVMHNNDNTPRLRDFDGKKYLYNGRTVNNPKKGVYIHCTPNKNPNQSEPSKIIIDMDEPAPPIPTDKYMYYTWGDVEGDVTFLEGCMKLKNMYFPNAKHYVSIGDVLGAPRAGDTEEINDAKTIKFALRAAIKIIGNRDLNKLRIPAEFLHAHALQKWPKTKDEMKTVTYGLRKAYGVSDARLDGTWWHDDKIPLTSEQQSETIVNNFRGQTRRSFFESLQQTIGNLLDGRS